MMTERFISNDRWDITTITVNMITRAIQKPAWMRNLTMLCASRAGSLTDDYNVCLGADSFYYYTVALDPGESALFFDEIYLTNADGENTCPEGYHYQVEFIAEIIDISSVDRVLDVSVPTATGDDITLMVNNEASGGYYDEKYLCWY